MATMLDKLRQREGVQIGVVTAMRVRDVQHRNVDGLDVFVIPEPGKITGWRQNRSLKHCRTIVERWKPDLLHIYSNPSYCKQALQ